MKKIAHVIANFGGPRTLQEVEPFLRALLTDKDVVRTKFPQPIHNLLFNKIAKKRALTVAQDYAKIGGGSPIFGDTEYIAEQLAPKLNGPLLTFHRYLPATHAAFIEQMHHLDCDQILVFPMFPQFTYATTGSIARFFQKNLHASTLQKLRWVKSYPSHPAYIQAFQNTIQNHLTQNHLEEEQTLLLFSAHGVPQKFIDTGDLYADECRLSFEKIMQHFPNIEGKLCFQSKFGPGEWLRPYTEDVCKEITAYKRQNIVFVPLSFTSDHIETLFEVEELYMPLITERKLHPYRVPALNRDPEWIEAICTILSNTAPCINSMLIRS